MYSNMADNDTALGFYNTLSAGLLVLITLISTAFFVPEIAKKLFTSAARCLVQIQLLTFIIQPIFDVRNLYLTLFISFSLLVLGVIEVRRRCIDHKRQDLFFRLLFCLLLIVTPISIFSSRFALDHKPWWNPMKFLPFFGMLVGNNISCIAVAISHALRQIEQQKDQVEVLLSYGALPREIIFTRLLPESLQLACLPTLNQMSIAGLVTIPGAMTGAILGGASIQQAALMQINLLFIISSTSILCTFAALLLTYNSFFDSQSRLFAEPESN